MSKNLEQQAMAAVKPTLLARLRHDIAGNTLMIAAGAIIPLTAMIGAGVDMSRAYVVKTRMQGACDAGALAGRRAMVGNVMTNADRDEAVRLFRFNFPNGTLESAPMDSTAGSTAENKIVVALNNNGQLGMTASTMVPSAVFTVGNGNRITVSCTGEEFFVNTDVMLVLDTTGSMNCTISDPTTCGQTTEKPGSKLSDLRGAVKQLYADIRPAQTALEARNLRLRVGFVQYASTVNVGKLIYAANTGYINNPANYDLARYWNSNGDATLASPTQTATWLSGLAASNWEGCIVERQTGDISSTATSIPAAAWDMDIAMIPSSSASRWTPLVPSLARDTPHLRLSPLGVSGSAFSGSYKPANYNDTELVTRGFSACPRRARHLESWPSVVDFNNHVDTLTTGIGGTYHDIGMIWGTRMVSSTGIFGGLNPNTFNNVEVSKTIVLVTDGLMSPNRDVYGAYNVERTVRRIYPGGPSRTNNMTTAQSDELKARHEKRFNLMCERAKASPINADIWVIAILDTATPISTSLTNCASAGQAKKISSVADLTAAFRSIADKVGNLRVGS